MCLGIKLNNRTLETGIEVHKNHSRCVTEILASSWAKMPKIYFNAVVFLDNSELILLPNITGTFVTTKCNSQGRLVHYVRACYKLRL